MIGPAAAAAQSKVQSITCSISVMAAAAAAASVISMKIGFYERHIQFNEPGRCKNKTKNPTWNETRDAFD